jgi:uncharacterized SAM-binding protein YcdF (DUF218 family)
MANDPQPDPWTRPAETTPDKAPRRPAWRRALRLLLRTVQGVVGALILAAMALVFTPAGDWLAARLRRVDPLEGADYLVVLGGRDDRVCEAVRLYRLGWAPRIIITSYRQDSEELAELARQFGVPSEALLLDRRATRTVDHPRTVAELPDVDPETHRFILVTSEMHTSRSGAVFEAAGYRHVIVRAPIWEIRPPNPQARRHWPGRASQLFAQAYETCAWLLYRARGWV